VSDYGGRGLRDVSGLSSIQGERGSEERGWTYGLLVGSVVVVDDDWGFLAAEETHFGA
jgi:hypothetical protein